MKKLLMSRKPSYQTLHETAGSCEMERRQFLSILTKAGGVVALTSFSNQSQHLSAQPVYQQIVEQNKDELIYYSAAQLSRFIRKKEVSSEELVSAFLRCIESVNPKLNAVVQLAADQALAQACEADKNLAKGNIDGPLHGVPMTIKDSLDTAGIVSAAGTTGRASYIPQQDATVVARLRAAGAILLGKTNTPELTMSYETDNAVYGRTNNPYDLSRTPGGSSGGAAAIIAAGGSPLDIGSDTGGSIRVPSHFCGTAGLKPTSGRVPRTGHMPPPGGVLDALTQLGPMASYVEDLALVLPIIIGPDGKDPSIIPMPMGDPEKVDLKCLRLNYHTDNGIMTPTTETVETTTKVAKLLSEICPVEEETLPQLVKESASEINNGLWLDGGAEMERLLSITKTAELSDRMRGLLSWQKANALTVEKFSNLFARWSDLRGAMLSFMDKYDAIICPVCAHPARPHQEAMRNCCDMFSYTFIYNLTGWPCAVVRAGTSPEGLPIGVQIVARPWCEDVVLAVAQYIEDALGGWKRPSI